MIIALAAMRRVSIFLSSPSDVRPEREAAEQVVVRLCGVYAAHVDVALERWEQRFYEADRSFQEAIAAMSTFDVVVGILWKRVGIELPPDKFSRSDGTTYESGTAYEIEMGIAASQSSGRPSVYVFKKTASILFEAERVDEQRTQKDALDKWWTRISRDSAGRYLVASNDFSTTEEFEVKLEECLTSWLKEKGYIPNVPVWDVLTNGSPYPGLLAYDRARSAVFFGRGLPVEQACEELLKAAGREKGVPALFVIGASGAGKSSLVRAGLLPRLVQPGVAAGVDFWRVVTMVPSTDNLATLAAVLYSRDGLPELASSAQGSAMRWAEVAATSPEAGADAVAWALDRAGEAESRRTTAGRDLRGYLLLVVDQLEELFGSPDQRDLSRLLRALLDGGRVWLLTSLRSSHYAQLQLDPDLLALKRGGAIYDLPPPGPAEIADIVKGPARAAELEFAERGGLSLASTLIEATPSADALPLLQMTLAQLFKARESSLLTFEAYDAIGGVEGAIAAHADTVLAEAPLTAQREFNALIPELVRDVTHVPEGPLRFAVRNANRKTFEINDARTKLIETLIEGRLLVSDEDTLRVSHEALLRRWSRAQECIERIAAAELHRARRRTLRAIAAAIAFFVVASGAVWQWSNAVAERNVAVANQLAIEAELLGAQEASSLETSVLLAVESIRRHRTAAADIAIRRGISLLPKPQFELDNAFPSKRLIVSDDSSLLLAAADQRLEVWKTSNGALVRTIKLPLPAQSFAFAGMDHLVTLVGNESPRLLLWRISDGRLIAEAKTDIHASHLSVSPEGKYVATDGLVGKVQLWSTRELRLVTSFSYEDVNVPGADSRSGIYVYFTRDEELVLGRASFGNSVQVWSAKSGEKVRDIDVLGIRNLAVSPDGRHFLCGFDNYRLGVWDYLTGEKVVERVSKDLADEFAYSGDGRVIAFVEDESVHIMNATTLAQLKTINASFALGGLQLNRDGSRMATLDQVGTIRVFDTRRDEISLVIDHDSEPPVAFSGDLSQAFVASASSKLWGYDISQDPSRDLLYTRGPIADLDFSSDGKFLAAAGEEGTAGIWSVPGWRKIAQLPHEDQVSRVRFNPRGNLLATAEGFVGGEEPRLGTSSKLWKVMGGELVATFRHKLGVAAVSFNSDGSLLSTGSEDGTAAVWSVKSRRRVAELPIGISTTVNSIAFVGPQELIAVNALDKTIIWDHRMGVIRQRLSPGGGSAGILSSRDGKLVLTTGRDLGRGINDKEELAAVWETSNWRRVAQVEHKNYITAAALSPDGGVVATGGFDNILKVWLSRSGRTLFQVNLPNFVHTLAFTPDGTAVAAAGVDGTIRLYDVREAREIGRISEKGWNRSMAISPDGKFLASGTNEGQIKISLLRIEDLIEEACRRVKRAASSRDCAAVH